MCSSLFNSKFLTLLLSAMLCITVTLIAVCFLNYIPRHEEIIFIEHDGGVDCSPDFAPQMLRDLQFLVKRVLGRSFVKSFPSQFCMVEQAEETIEMPSTLVNITGIPALDIVILVLLGSLTAFMIPKQMRQGFLISFTSITPYYLLRLLSSAIGEQTLNMLDRHRLDCQWSLVKEILLWRTADAEESCTRKIFVVSVNLPFALNTIGSSVHHDIAMLVAICVFCSIIFLLINNYWEITSIFILFTFQLLVLVGVSLAILGLFGSALIILILWRVFHELGRFLFSLMIFVVKQVFLGISLRIARAISFLAFRCFPQFAESIFWMIANEYFAAKLEANGVNPVLYRSIIDMLDRH